MESDKKKKKSGAANPQRSAATARAGEVAAQMRSGVSDPDGSYTGVPLEPDEAPVQDADDL